MQKHFDSSQFEASRKDKWRKLKQTAVPTIFSHRNTPKVREPSQRKRVLQDLEVNSKII
jgi:hypothetical protein